MISPDQSAQIYNVYPFCAAPKLKCSQTYSLFDKIESLSLAARDLGFHRLRSAVHGLGLARERRLLNAQHGREERADARVRGHAVPRAELDDVPGDELLRSQRPGNPY